MSRPLLLIALLALLTACSRNDEYRYIRQLSLIEPTDTLLPRIRERLIQSEFRKTYDQTLPDRIGSSFTNFRHIRAYQRVLDDSLVYIMLKADRDHLADDLRNRVIKAASSLILSRHTPQEFLTGLDRIITILKDSGDPLPALDRLAHQLKQT